MTSEPGTPIEPDSSGSIPDATPRSRLGPALGGFFVDAIVAGITFLLTMVPCLVVWALLHALIARSGGAKQALAYPQPFVLLWMTLIASATTAGLMYLWRHPATAAERAASLAAIRRPRTWQWIALTVAAVLAMTTATSLLAQRLGIELEPSNLAPIEAAMAAHPWFVSLFAIVLAPLYEELFFRRVLFGRVWAAGWPKLGMLLSALGFASLHETPGAFAWFPYVLMGVAFAWVYRRTGTLWASIAAHALNNAVAMLALQTSLGAG